jgi:sugar/nucleoside kinase (ribokinase family)
VSVLVVGDIVTDILAVHSGPLAVDSDTAARISLTGGGSAANTAAWFAYSGTTVHLVGVVGEDVAGTDRLAELAAAGVGGTAIRRAADAPTGSVIVLAQAQDRTMLCDRGANHLLTPSDVDAALSTLDGLRHLHLSGYTLLDASSRSAGQHALRAAAERGLTTSVDAASAAPLRRVGGPAFLDWIRGTDLLLANLDEARALTPATDATEDATAVALALTGYVPTVIVKQGPAGATWADRDGTRLTVPAEPATVVDSTGAGDAFAAALISARLSGADPGTALRSAVALGARAVTTLGGRPPRPPGPRR